MFKRLIIIAVLSLAFSMQGRGQFVVSGNESPLVNWNYFTTENYKFIYPQGYDSLAFEYAREWEMAAKSLGRTIGYGPNTMYKDPLPVILHPYSAKSNASVIWAPRRMDVYTTPQTSAPEPLYWQRNLAIHEGRHSCQEQFTQEPLWKPLSYVTGEAAAGILDVFWGDISMMEGDAVCAETGLSESGRGRNAEFLEYYRVAFEAGDFRNYEQWRYGSLTRFTPDYYKIGYIMQAGMRTIMEDPSFAANTYLHFISRGFNGKLNNFRRTAREDTGLKFNDIYKCITDSLDRIWEEEAQARAPFQAMERISGLPGEYFPQYEGITVTDYNVFAHKNSLVCVNEIVSIHRGCHETPIVTISSDASGLDYCPLTGRIYWSDYRPDLRYEKHSYSDIKWMNAYGDHTIHTLAKGGLYFNPRSHPQDSLVAVVQILKGGESAVTVLSENDGRVVEQYICPDGYVATEAIWDGDILYCILQSHDGLGIYRARDFKCILEPSPVQIKDLTSHEDLLLFASDRTGVTELYSLDPHKKTIRQVTNLRHGGNDFYYSGDHLYYTSLMTNGRYIYRTPSKDLPNKEVDFSKLHSYAMADALSEQETVKLDEKYELPDTIKPQPYNKLHSAFNLHSWLPIWADYDEISDITFENVFTVASPGVTGFFQNELGTVYGYAGASYGPVDSLGWGLGAHMSVSYRGLLPVFKASLDANRGGLSGYLQTYVPLNFSSNGRSRGIIPQLTYSFSGTQQNLLAAISAYSVAETPASRYYPKYGIGGAIGCTFKRELINLYGYAPGFGQCDGFRLSANWLGYANQFSGAISYALPFGDIDWSLGDFIYVRNFEFLPSYSFLHQDYTQVYNVHALSLGADAVLGHLWVARTDIRIGGRYTYRIGHPAGPHAFNLIMSVDL